MKITSGKGTTTFGPGIAIKLTGDEVATAIDDYLEMRGVSVTGPRTITVNGGLCKEGEVYADPSGGFYYSGRGKLTSSGAGGGGCN